MSVLRWFCLKMFISILVLQCVMFLIRWGFSDFDRQVFICYCVLFSLMYFRFICWWLGVQVWVRWGGCLGWFLQYEMLWLVNWKQMEYRIISSNILLRKFMVFKVIFWKISFLQQCWKQIMMFRQMIRKDSGSSRLLMINLVKGWVSDVKNGKQ